jgi:hypothetical protein
MSGHKAKRVLLHSRPSAFAKLDGRTKEAALMRRVRAELTAHVGGNPNAVQRALIERAVILSLRVAQIDARIVAGETLTLHDNNFALAWNNALRRTMAAIGLEPAAVDQMQTLDAYLAAKGNAA